jgi:hypothetical protein
MINTDSVFIYAQPNDIYDALIASKQKLTLWQLRKYALDHGFIVPEDIEREALCLRIASIPFDHLMLQELSELLKTESRSPKTSSQKVDGEISSDTLRDLLPDLKDKRQRDNISISLKADGSPVIRVAYTDIDHNITRLKQRKPKEAIIEINTTNDGKTTLRYPSDERVKEIVNCILDTIDEQENTSRNRFSLNLSEFLPAQTNDFFFRLINNIEDLPLGHVVKIGIHKSKSSEDEDDNEEENDEVSQSLVSQINKASMSGNDLLASREIQEFLHEGRYYIHTIRWQTQIMSLRDNQDQPIEGAVRLEVQCSPPDKMTHLSYEAVNYLKYVAEKSNFNSTPVQLSRLLSKNYVSMIEEAAYKCFTEIKENSCGINGSMQSGD